MEYLLNSVEERDKEEDETQWATTATSRNHWTERHLNVWISRWTNVFCGRHDNDGHRGDRAPTQPLVSNSTAFD